MRATVDTVVLFGDVARMAAFGECDRIKAQRQPVLSSSREEATSPHACAGRLMGNEENDGPRLSCASNKNAPLTRAKSEFGRNLLQGV